MECCICLLFAIFSIFLGIIMPLGYIFTKIFASPYPTLHRTKREHEFFDTTIKKHLKFPSLQDESTVNLSVVIPAYNEQNRLPPMLDECLEYLNKRQKDDPEFKFEIIIVSDGSTDSTVEVALEYCMREGSDKVRVLDLEYNRGKGGAVKLGVASTRGAVILFADADGATKFEDLWKLESALMQLTSSDYRRSPSTVAKRSVIICGSRAHLEQQAIAERSAARNLLMHGFHFIVWLLAVRSLRDTQCGFKLFTRSAARKCFRSLHVTRWAFDVELLYIAERLNVRLAEVAVRWTEIDGSKLVPVLSWLQMGKDLIMIWLRYWTGAWKLVPED